MMIRIVPHLDATHSLVFDVIERDLMKTGKVLKMGRFTDRFDNPDRIAFKSKVVSRGHAEIWIENNHYYIRDTKSSSGTFLNRARLSPPNQQSSAFLLHDGDIIQLGIDYQGGKQELFRCVKMRIEIKNQVKESNSSYCLNSFKSQRKVTDITSSNDIEECCICLYAIAPFQALFVAPCSHAFHFKCCYPLLNNYPGFNCPLCRTYADLDANVAIEADEVIEMFKNVSTNSDDDAPLEKDLHSVDKIGSSHVHSNSTTNIATTSNRVMDL
ncbi:SMAD/FHA domain-containing protein, partial [Backusella circina FSU 941]